MEHSNAVFICIDVGSQSIRCSLIDRRGHQLYKAQLKLRSPDAPNPGWAETDAEYFWQSLCQVCSETSAYARQHGHQAKAIGLTAQRASVVNVGQDGKALRPVILWSDQRRTLNTKAVGGLTGIGMKIAGVSSTVAHFQAEAEINWLASHQPELWAQTDKFLFLSGYLNYRLCGQYHDSIASQVGFVPFDYRKQQWAHPRKWHWRALPGIKASQLPQLVSPGDLLGTLSADAANALQLEAGLPLVACATDKACEVLGSACTGRAQACLSFGTAATVNVTVDKYLEVERFVPSYPAAIKDHHLCEVQINRGFWLVSWFKREFAQLEAMLAREQSIPTEDLLDKMLQQTPAGAQGLIAQPYWSPGVRVPGPEARGALLGFNDSHTRAHVYRALLEGLIYALKEGLQRIERKTGERIAMLRVAGGGSQSDEVMQLTANIFDLPVERNLNYEASSNGVAICCAVATGVYPDFAQAVSKMTAMGREFQPQPGAATLHQRIYNDVYLKMYKQLKPLYHQLLNINP